MRLRGDKQKQKYMSKIWVFWNYVNEENYLILLTVEIIYMPWVIDEGRNEIVVSSWVDHDKDEDHR